MRFLHRRGLKSMPCINRSSVMGTAAYQEVYGIGGPFAVENVCRELHRLDALWSPRRPKNMVDRIRSSAGQDTVYADQDTVTILSTARALGIRSQGTFDITADPVIRLWRDAARKQRLPKYEDIESARCLVRIEDLHMGSDTGVRLPRRGQGIDLGGIGKGYAADTARSLYEHAGIRHAAIDIGGNVLVMNAKPDGSPWRIGIRNPLYPRGEPIGYIEAEHCSVVTSGDYERFFECTDQSGTVQRFHHMLDPRTGRPADTGLSGVTVMCGSSTYADALATAAFVLGLEEGMALCDSFKDTHCLFIDKKGIIHLSYGMRGRFVKTR